MGGSCLAQCYGLLSGATPDLDDAQRLKNFFAVIQELSEENLLLAYHDRSDGGLLATVVEMMFAGRLGVSMQLAGTEQDVLATLFNEELGAVIQVADRQLDKVQSRLEAAGCHWSNLGQVESEQVLTIRHAETLCLQIDRLQLQRTWSETSYRLQALRDNPETAQEEFDRLLDAEDPGLSAKVTFDPAEKTSAAIGGTRPRIAILREQGVNSQYEMAAAFMRAGFDAVDVHMSDLLEGRDTLHGYQGMVACGGFSFGDVLGAGGGWARSILYHAGVRDQFASFFANPDRFALGICNGCQMFSHLKTLIPGAEHWPVFLRNRSEQFEARLSLVTIHSGPSIFLTGMDDCRLPIVTSHGEGRATFANNTARSLAESLVTLRYVDNYGRVTEKYPANPNGSAGGICGLTTTDGRVTIMMPHPERVVTTTQNSWHPDEWGDEGPWMRMFRNARAAVS